jgi:predicted DNA-binding transcriptional regulator YafY
LNKTILRQWAMLRLLPRFPRKVAVGDLMGGLARLGFDTTIRTIQRDLNVLALSFPLLSDEAKPQGWSWAADAPQLSLPNYDQQSAMGFLVARLHLNHILPKSVSSYLQPWFEAAGHELAGLGLPSNELAKKVRVESRSLSLIPPEIKAHVLELVYDSLIHEHCLEVTYSSRSTQKIKNYVVHPVALVIVDSVSYLVVIFDEHTDVRHLALHRIENALPTDIKRRIPAGFDLDAYIAKGSFGLLRDASILDLRFRMKTLWASHLRETPIGVDQRLNDLENGWTEISVSVPNTSQLRWWLRGFGPDLIVESPDSLVNEFRIESQSLGVNYAIPKFIK